MYLEISSRQSGKTARLLLAIQQHLQDGGIALVTALHAQMGMHIFKSLPEWYQQQTAKLFVLGSTTQAEEQMRGLYHAQDPSVRRFYDEFDFIDPNRVDHHDNSYYCTTASRLRDERLLQNPEAVKQDVLLALIAANDFTYVSRVNDKQALVHLQKTKCDNFEIIRQGFCEAGEVFETDEVLAAVGAAQNRKMAAALNISSAEYEYDDPYDDGN